MAAFKTRGSPDLANGGPHPQSTPAAARKASNARGQNAAMSFPNSEQGSAPTRSFSGRAAPNLNYTTRKPAPGASQVVDEQSNTPRGLPPTNYLHDLPITSSEDKELQSPVEHSTAVNAPSMPSRSNTIQSTSGASTKKDWASDRSPLQKLEVTLSGISKEEKRARVQQAEMRLRERLARQQLEKDQAAAAAAAAGNNGDKAHLNQSTPSGNHLTHNSTRGNGNDRVQINENTRASAASARSQGAATHDNAVGRMNGQHSENRVPGSAQWARVPNTGALPMKAASPMRSNSEREQRGWSKPSTHTRSVSHHEHLNPSPLVSSITTHAERKESPSTLESISGASLPRSKPRQTVSFDVPPPTPPPIFEWRNAPVARIGAADFDFQNLDIDRSQAWWEGGASTDRRKSRALPKNYQTAAQKVTGKIVRVSLRVGDLIR